MKQLVLTDFTQKTSLANKTATAYLEFNGGELTIPISQDALVSVVEYISAEPTTKSIYPQLDTKLPPVIDNDMVEAYSGVSSPPPFINPLQNPLSIPYDEDTGGVVDDDGFMQF